MINVSLKEDNGFDFFADKGRLSGFVYELSKDSYVFLRTEL